LFWLFVLVAFSARQRMARHRILAEKFLFGANDSAFFKPPPFVPRTSNGSPSKPKSVHPALAGSSGIQRDVSDQSVRWE
jgi:hypothetical protein